MSEDKRPHTEEASDEAQTEVLPAEGPGTKPKRDWVEWGKTAGKVSDDFMPDRIDDFFKD